MTDINVRLMVNGREHRITTGPHRTLLDVLRDDLGLTGTKDACGQGDCGACVVVMDGQAVNACLILTPQADGSEILTVEGLAESGKLHPLQQAFAEKFGFQCGYCTPGMLMASYALLMHNPNPSAEEVKHAISGNLCRCTGYQPIVESVLHATRIMREAGHG